MSNGIYVTYPEGGTSATPPPGGGPSTTPAPVGVNDPYAIPNPGGGGTGAPTPMPKQDSSSQFVQFGTDIRAARQATLEARGKLEHADTVLNGLSAELRALASNPADRQLRFAQQAFYPMLRSVLGQAKTLLAASEKPDQNAINLLTQAEWIAANIEKL